jgi:hypothetical protein
MAHQTTLCVGTWTVMRVIHSNGRSNLRHQSAMAATTKYLSKKSNARDVYREQTGHSYRPIARRNTSKMSAVDQPNKSTPFIAVIGPSSCQRCVGMMSPYPSVV